MRNDEPREQSVSNAVVPQVTHGRQKDAQSAGSPDRQDSSDRFDVYERAFVYCGLGLVALGLFYIGIDFKKSPLERTTSAQVAMLALEFMEFAVGTAMLLGGWAFSAKRGQKSHVIDRAAILFGFAVIAIAIFLQPR